MQVHSLLSLGLVAAASAVDVPTLPREYSAVIQMKMPYIQLEMPLRVLTSSTAQKIEYYDGLQVDVSSHSGTYKYSFNNSRRVCSYSPPTAGPMLEGEEPYSVSLSSSSSSWSAMPFFPDLAQYSFQGEELVGGILCQKYTLNAHHGNLGTMDDHLSFYWDAVLNKPVRWRMHSRHVTFGSHTDEYIMDYLSFQPGAPAEDDLSLPEMCERRPQTADITVQIHSFLAAAHAARPASKSSDEAHATLFGAFLSQHGKAYALEEYAQRSAVFQRNMLLVADLNEQHAGHASFKGNKFLDMTVGEVLRFRGGKSKGSSMARRSADHWQHVRAHGLKDAVSVPTDFDWRTARPGVVGAVKDQAMCGSCWAYGLTEPIESIQAIRTGKLVELPEQFVVDCLWTNNTGSSGCNSGCDGGDSDVGGLEIVRKFGGVIPSAAAYGAYLSVNGYCKDVRLMEVGAKITGWVDIKKRDEKALLQALFTEGPMSVGIMVPQEMLYYDSGVLKVEACRHNETQIDHAVVATGFGSDEHGTPYYTIRNSWSTYWGDQGYIRIARGELDCCVSCQAGYPELAAVADSNLVVV